MTMESIVVRHISGTPSICYQIIDMLHLAVALPTASLGQARKRLVPNADRVAPDRSLSLAE